VTAPARPLDAIEAAVAVALANTLPGVVDQLAESAGPRAYSVTQVAERLEVSESTVRRLIADGHLAVVPHLSPVRVAAIALDEFLAGKR
jgi:excisionase family DNA binding protein